MIGSVGSVSSPSTDMGTGLVIIISSAAELPL